MQAILLLEAVPAETPGVLLEPARECTGPQLPPEADAIVHRNLVAIARAVRVCGMLVPTDWAPAGITDHIYHLASDSVCAVSPDSIQARTTRAYCITTTRVIVRSRDEHLIYDWEREPIRCRQIVDELCAELRYRHAELAAEEIS
ncbi:MAG: hypothetical protein KatS3mg038_3348 [Candidatus Kapaibacterium sp.]|nr:MAG: hypothetical protein KatS3mg038_3348 [Candidatus Kapabacteria bacterium]